MAPRPTHPIHEAMTTGDVARLYTSRGFPLTTWQVRRVFESGLLPEPSSRIGGYRLIPPHDLPALEAALQGIGYLPSDATLAQAT
jgi:hypothetical protein